MEVRASRQPRVLRDLSCRWKPRDVLFNGELGKGSEITLQQRVPVRPTIHPPFSSEFIHVLLSLVDSRRANQTVVAIANRSMLSFGLEHLWNAYNACHTISSVGCFQSRYPSGGDKCNLAGTRSAGRNQRKLTGIPIRRSRRAVETGGSYADRSYGRTTKGKPLKKRFKDHEPREKRN